MKIIKILPLFGLGLFAVILWNLDWSMIYSSFLGLNPVFLLLALLMQFPVILTKALKWKVLMRPYSIEFPLSSAVKAWLVGYTAGIITPGRMGDLTRAYYLKGRLPLGKSLTTVIADRVIDVLILFFLSVLGIVMFVALFATGLGYGMFIPLISVFFVVFVFLLFILSRKGLVVRLTRPFYRRIVPERHKKKAGRVFHDFYKGLDIMRKNKRCVMLSVCISIFSWIFIFFQFYVLSLSMNMGVSLLFISSIIPVIVLLDALPISFSGVGTRDAALIFFLGFVSLSPETAVSFSLLILAFNYLVLAGFGMFFWFRNPIKIGSG
jgi:uncharacterized protein (TIRG00374 family)